MGIEVLPAAHTPNHSYLKKDQCDRKAARHPLLMLVNLSFENEHHRNTGSNDPQGGVRSSSNTERSGIAHADIEAEGSCHEHTGNVDSPDDPMELPETLAKAI